MLVGVLVAAPLPGWADGDTVATTVRTNLVRNGTFEAASTNDAGRPAGWGQPDGLGVQWVEDSASGTRGPVIRMDTRVIERDLVKQWQARGMTDTWDIPNPADNPVAETYGLSYYSDAFVAVSGQAYRVTFDFKGSGGAKVWVRGWGEVKGQRRRRYEAVINCADTAGGWRTFSEVFHPTRLRPEVTELKVMLYAFHPPGLYAFDNVCVEPIPAAEYERDRRKTGSARSQAKH